MRLVSFSAFAAALVLALFLSGCGGGSSAELSAQSGKLTSADEVLAAAREALSLVISYRSDRHMVVKSQADGRGLVMGNISLTWSTSDRIHLRSRGTEEGEEEQAFELIATDGRVFARESKTGNIWTEYETDPNPDNREVGGVLAAVRRFSAAPDFVPDMDEAELVGEEVIDGFSVYHVIGATSVKQEFPDGVPAEVLDDLPLQQSDSTYHLYVSTSNFLPRRLLTETSLRWETSSGEAPRDEDTGVEPVYMESTDNFLDYNVPVTIELPQVP